MNAPMQAFSCAKLERFDECTVLLVYYRRQPDPKISRIHDLGSDYCQQIVPLNMTSNPDKIIDQEPHAHWHIIMMISAAFLLQIVGIDAQLLGQ